MQQSSHKLYILVDRTLTKSQQAVQACHAVAEFVIYHGAGWKHQSLVLLAINGEEEMYQWDKKLTSYKKAGFYETHWNGRFTALACHGCDQEVRELNLL